MERWRGLARCGAQGISFGAEIRRPRFSPSDISRLERRRQRFQPGDFVAPLHRDLGVFLMRGADPGRLMSQLMAKENGLSRGKDSGLHGGDLEHGIFGSTSMLGSSLPVAVGAAQLSATIAGLRSAFPSLDIRADGDLATPMRP